MSAPRMKRAERDERVGLIAIELTGRWSQHQTVCQLDPCPGLDRYEAALKALYELRRA